MHTVDFTSYTNPGFRDINEDSHGVAVYDKSYCFVVADGLGGHGGGEVASQCAVQAVCDLFSKTGYTDRFFADAFHAAQSAILEAQHKAHAISKMKTTLVVLVVHQKSVFWAHIGDSRLYCYKGTHLKCRTIDHSVPQMLVLSGEIKEQEIRHHPDRNRLLRVLGIQGEEPRFEEGKPLKISGVHTFLLCTDGYWELVTEEEMRSLLSQSSTLEEWLINMNSRIKESGVNTDMDNYTAIAVRVKAKGFWER